VDRHSEWQVQEWRSTMREQYNNEQLQWGGRYNNGLVQWEEGTIMDKYNERKVQ